VTEDLVNSVSRYLARRTSRRSFLMKAALTGSAIAAGPVRFLLRPQSAWAISPGNCPSGSQCQGGYTEFCCTVNTNPGDARNVCPSYSYVGGWWKACSGNYEGSFMCSGTTRYFLDCNLKPNNSCPSHCSQGNCNYWPVCAHDFRYGNCHANNGYGTTPVVCRLISCIPPVDYTGGCFECNSTFMDDYSTCNMESDCYCGYQCNNADNTYVGSCGDSCGSGCSCC
jgi:hypothetical protein